MCGICGIIGKKTNKTLVEEMLSTIVHRGPDDSGIFVEDDVFLGHRRLSILDVSSAGHQPMIYGDYIIVFNGEIYNYIEIREELISLRHSFHTETDTEVILHAYEQWGSECFQKLRGMWGLCIYDKRKEQLILSRDRFGIKPLYYGYNNGELFFSSEIASLFVCGIKRKPNISRLVAYLMVDINEDRETTFFEGIYQLPGGSIMIYDLASRQISKKIYYDLETRISSSTVEEYDAEYFNVVKQHLRSDVKLGACLSGGLDSSTLVAVAQSILNKDNIPPMTVVTAKSEDQSNDESNYAEMVVKHSGLKWSIAYPTYQNFVDYHEEMLRVQEEPVGSPSIFMQFWVMKKAKEHDIKVMLDGQGGDETLLGYERYYASYLLMLFKRFELAKFFKEYKRITCSSKLTMSLLLKYFVYFLVLPVRRLYLSRRMSFVKPEYRMRFFKEYKGVLKQDDNITHLQIDEMVKGHLSALLHYEDRNSMYFSIESRVPYVDHILVEKALGLNIEDKISDGWTKYVLRKIADRFLPREIAWRKNKYGFEAPEKIWLKQYVEHMQQTVNESKLLREVLTVIPDLSKIDFRERWRIYNIAVWEKQYLV